VEWDGPPLVLILVRPASHRVPLPPSPLTTNSHLSNPPDSVPSFFPSVNLTFVFPCSPPPCFRFASAEFEANPARRGMNRRKNRRSYVVVHFTFSLTSTNHSSRTKGSQFVGSPPTFTPHPLLPSRHHKKYVAMHCRASCFRIFCIQFITKPGARGHKPTAVFPLCLPNLSFDSVNKPFCV